MDSEEVCIIAKVRRGGRIDRVAILDTNGRMRNKYYGNRRARQISKRHWVTKVCNYFVRGSEELNLQASSKPANKEEKKFAPPTPESFWKEWWRQR